MPNPVDTNAQVYRFGDKVALAFTEVSGPTIYLTHDEADELAKALKSFAKDVRAGDHINSKLTPFSKQMGRATDNG